MKMALRIVKGLNGSGITGVVREKRNSHRNLMKQTVEMSWDMLEGCCVARYMLMSNRVRCQGGSPRP